MTLSSEGKAAIKSKETVLKNNQIESVLGFMTIQPGNCSEAEMINSTLREHEENTEDWKYQSLAKELYRWAEIFNLEFKLQNQQPVIVFNRTRSNTLATYMRGRSGFGTRYTITINNRYLNDPFYRILRRLLHEMIHQWQELHGKIASRSSYHNKQFIKLKKWHCGCTNIWCAVALHAQCLECGSDFEKDVKRRSLCLKNISGSMYYSPSSLKLWRCWEVSS